MLAVTLQRILDDALYGSLIEPASPFVRVRVEIVEDGAVLREFEALLHFNKTRVSLVVDQPAVVKELVIVRQSIDVLTPFDSL